jgi:pimeloyl-ACP methyl ester carboxylesterase
MKTSYERLSTSDHLELQGLFYTPEKPSKKVVLHIHGMAGNFYENRFVDDFAKTFTNNGYSFATFNNRGHDYGADFRVLNSKTEKFIRIGDANETFEDCILDIEAYMNFLETKGYSEVVLSGHSLGAVKAVYYQALEKNNRVKALVLESPPDMIGLAEKEKDYDEFTTTAKEMVKNNKGKELLPKLFWQWYPITANTYLNFFDKKSKTRIFNIANKENSVLSEITVPILAIIGGKDDIVIKSAKEDLSIIKGLATKCSKFDSYIIENALHSYFGYEQKLADIINKWIQTLQ